MTSQATQPIHHRAHSHFAGVNVGKVLIDPVNSEYIDSFHAGIWNAEEQAVACSSMPFEGLPPSCGIFDKNFFGWNGFPLETNGFFRVHSAPTDVSFCVKQMECCAAAALKCLSSPQNISHLVSSMSSSKVTEFNAMHAQFFKSLVVTLGLSAFQVFLPFLKAAIFEERCANLPSDIFLSRQCLAAEILSGSVRGSKYFSAADVSTLLKDIVPLLRHVINDSCLDEEDIWSSALKFLAFDRHMQRLSWIVPLLFNKSVNVSESHNTIVTCKRLQLVEALLHELSWRSGSIQSKLLADIESHLFHPLEQVRSAIGICLSTLFCVCWEPPRFTDGIILSGRGQRIHPGVIAIVDSIARELDVKSMEETKTFGMSEDLKKRRSYLKQTTLSWVERLLPWVEDTFMSPILPLLPTLVPIIFSILQDPDKELADYASRCVEWVANVPLVPEDVLYVSVAFCCVLIIPSFFIIATLCSVVSIMLLITGRRCWSLYASLPTPNLGMCEQLFQHFCPSFSSGNNSWFHLVLFSVL